MDISPRLRAIAGLVAFGSVVADIGTDHALLPIHLIKEGICRQAILTDIKKGPLDTARANVAAAGLSPMCDFYLTDGIREILPLSPDYYIIAGMGGETIAGILSVELTRYIEKSRFILQPMTKQNVLREFLSANGYLIEDEQLVRENDRIYVIMNVIYNGVGEVLSPLQITCGKAHLERSDPDTRAYLESIKKELERRYIGCRIKHTDTDADRELISELGRLLEKLSENNEL